MADTKEQLLTHCWCRTEFVWVDKSDILNGLTSHCISPKCITKDRAEREKA